VPTEASDIVSLPERSLLPVQDSEPDAVHELALYEDQVRVNSALVSTVLKEDVKVTEGKGTGVGAGDEPPPPPQDEIIKTSGSINRYIFFII
jgi:hypothetical protein